MKKKHIKWLYLVFAALLFGFSFIWHIPRILVDTAKMGLDYLTLSRGLPRVSRAQMRADLEAAIAGVEHPFVLANEAQFARVKAELANPEGDDYIKKAAAYALEQADAMLDVPPCEYVLPDGQRLLEVSREVLNRMITLGFAWQVTGEEKYARRAWDELEQVCNFKDWNPSHFLDTAEMALAVTIGYDWFYDAFTDEQKDFLAQTVYDYALKPGNPNKLLSNWWSWSKTNWNHVCYGALGVANMAFADRWPEDSAKFLRRAYHGMPAAMEAFRPDGVYVEGNSYWEYGTSYLVYFIETSRNFFSTDYGLSSLPGFDKLGHFPLYISTPTGAFNTGDNRSFAPFAPAIFWFASENNEPMLTAYQRLSINNQDLPRKFALGTLWCDPALADGKLTLGTSVHLRSDQSQEFVLMRSAYCDPMATYAGVKGGYNYTNHGDLDIGTFVFESQGVRWFEDLGKCDYNSPGYFLGIVGGGRWKNYRKRAEGHNTLVINPGRAGEDQYPYARATFTSFENDIATLDMTDAYLRNGVKSVTRRFQMLPGYEGIRIVDNVSCKRESDIYWFAHTTAEIELAPDGRGATLRKDGKTITAHLNEGSAGMFSVMEALPLPESPARIDKEENMDYKKLTVHLQGVKDAVIDVTITA